MLAGILAILGMIPGIGSLVTSIVGKLYDSKVAIETAKIGGDTTTAVANVNTRVVGLQAIASSSLLTWLVVLFAVPLAAFVWKAVLWDIVIGSFYGCVGVTTGLVQCATFVTDPIRGQVGDWGNQVIWAIFGSAVVAHFIGSRSKS